MFDNTTLFYNYILNFIKANDNDLTMVVPIRRGYNYLLHALYSLLYQYLTSKNRYLL